MVDNIPFKEIVDFALGGGWGTDIPTVDSIPVAVIRGTDFSQVEKIQTEEVPRRWENAKRANKRLLKDGDLLLEISGGSSVKGQSTGRSLLITQEILDAFKEAVIPASFCRLIRVRSSVILPQYASYALQDMHRSGRAAFYENQSTGISNFQFKVFLDRECVRVPSLHEQASLVAVLRALDDKIAVNNRLASTADELCSLLLESRMKAKPSQFDLVPLSQTAKFINGRAFTKDATSSGRMVVRIAELNNGPGFSTVYNEIEVPEKYLARAGDVLFSWSGSLTVKRWFRSEAIVNQHIFKVIPNDGMPMWLVYQLVARKIKEFQAIAADKATTMGHIQRRHLDDPVDVPGVETLTELDSRIRPLWNRSLLAEQENLKLAELRDTLLPRLMSGEIRVKDAEKTVEEAT
ncbi:hypothetical protein [Glycomyces arizonensis]|uniref:hypothetical protein n=1 Tax=Glycomyces arizonensis TaxID=256035 RepID=UPI0012EBB83D|nr:hypothetical protein [Glycomyces arizonensis]